MNTLDEAYAYCENLTHRCGPHFSVGFRFLPDQKRRAIYAVYACCRYADDLVDEQQPQPPELLLKAWEDEIDHCYRQQPRHPITIALADTLLRYPIPKQGFLGLIEGCRVDLRQSRYPTFEALLCYCDLVATTIRDLSLPVFGYTDPTGLVYGRALSTALQLTNIARDIGEDLDRGRIYLPQDEIEAAGYSERALFGRVKNEAFLRLMARQCQRIRALFEQSAPLVPLVEDDARLALLLMRNVYIALIDRIEADPFTVLDRSIRLSPAEREGIIRQTLADTKTNPDGAEPVER
jgi:phytoene synthase